MTLIQKIKKLFKPSDKISFQQGMDLTDLPVCTFRQGKYKLNFLLDTGSTHNIIDSRYLSYLVYEDSDKSSTLFGLEGNVVSTKVCDASLFYKDKEYRDTFLVYDMSSAFDLVKKESGVTVHGVLGSGFFQKFQYVLDFKELIAYSKA